MRSFILPIPPGINATYKIGHKTLIKSQAAKDWEEECGYILIREKNKKPEKGILRVEIDLYILRERDIDSVIKITLDLLQRMFIFKNDSQVQQLLVTKHYDYPKAQMIVKVGNVREKFI